MAESFQVPFFDASADATVANLKTTSGLVFFIELSNIDNADYFLQLFDALAADVTLGTTTPNLSLLIPAGDSTFRGAMDKVFSPPLKFETAISYGVTTTATGSTGPTTALAMNAVYR